MKKVHWSKLPFKIGNWRKIIWLQNWINMFIKKGSHSNMKFVAKNLPKRMTFGLNFLVTLVTWMRIWYLICKKDLKFERFLIMNYSNILSQMIFPFIHFISNLTFERFSCIINNSNMLSEFLVNDVVPLLWMNDDTKVFEQHHAVLKINNRLHWPGASYPGRQLTIKHGTTRSSLQCRVRSPRRHTDDCNSDKPVNEYE